MTVELSVVIVNWNGGGLLRRCLACIVQHAPLVPYEVIVVDNASTDASVAWLHSEEAHALLGETPLRVIENQENRGFSQANNQAITLSNAPLLFLLNPDTEVRPKAIDTLIAGLQSARTIGACGPRLVNPDGSLQPSVWHNPPAAWEILLSGLKIYRLLPPRLRGRLLLGPHWDHAQRRKVPRLSGAALMVKRRVVEQVGGLDERFHMYGEDAEWCARMIRDGWVLLHEPEAVVVHHGSQSSIRRWGNAETLRRIIDGQLRFQSYFLPRRRLLINVLASATVSGLAHLRRSARGQSTDETGIALELYRKYLKYALGMTAREKLMAEKISEEATQS
ncbi:MAG: glycosyltransferase family 2 protein [Pyrinomonadaceae bacterium]|nr:glycosyltransferase family 2 protein [Pyrinomonadaceae bacterium]